MKRTAVLFVCMGNICRSPLAEGIFSHLVEKQHIADLFVIDSAGTGGWHAGHLPDPRSVAVANRHGIDISGQKARQVRAVDFVNFDLIFAMDEDNLDRLRASCPVQYKHKVHLFSQYATGRRESVPDPYYGGEDGFEAVYSMLLDGCISALEKLETGQDS
ncbi:low molecular weight protein-tyrosine-phosphatase [Agrobacterium rosae]|uniref:low molecular weight protein-tyrosine-phosphatase n=1 Tax=Agrobacterium rosae TaxID=1972867 RepID=UPI002A14011F|nr:low molecular weight protein-tyrosine-phosphatase [Agrobacterium rosae]MDX8314743.1 low molecular weight protein-tyrosine-phosphatase [Agrobacterium rosae]